MTIFGITLTTEVLQAAGGLVGAALVAWRGRKVANAVSRVAALYRHVNDARSESSPGGRSFTQAEVEGIVDEVADLVKDLSPLMGRLLGQKK